MTPLRPRWWERYPDPDAYAFRGRSLETGIDCWGLVHHVLPAEFGVAVNDFGAVYAGMNGRHAARAAIAAERPGWREVPWEEGAIALLREGGAASHVGVCTARRGVILHAHHSCGIDMLDIPRAFYWKDRLVACYLPQ